MIKVAELSDLIKRGNDVMVRGTELSEKTVAVINAVRDAGLTAVLFDQSFSHLTDLKIMLNKPKNDDGNTFFGIDPEEMIVFVMECGESVEYGDGTRDVLLGLTQYQMINDMEIINLHSVVVLHDSEAEINEEMEGLFDVITDA